MLWQNTITLVGAYYSGSGYPIVPPAVRAYNNVYPIIKYASILIFVIIGIIMSVFHIKSKKNGSKVKVKKWQKILFVISIIVFILNSLVKMYIDYKY